MRWKCDLAGQVSEMLRLLQMGPSKVLTTFLIPISEPLAAFTLGAAPYRNTVTPSLDSSDMYTSTVQSGPPSTDAALTRHPRLQTSYPPSAASPPSLAPGFSSAPPASSPP